MIFFVILIMCLAPIVYNIVLEGKIEKAIDTFFEQRHETIIKTDVESFRSNIYAVTYRRASDQQEVTGVVKYIGKGQVVLLNSDPDTKV